MYSAGLKIMVNVCAAVGVGVKLPEAFDYVGIGVIGQQHRATAGMDRITKICCWRWFHINLHGKLLDAILPGGVVRDRYSILRVYAGRGNRISVRTILDGSA